jgi:hypothetical protein
VFLLLTCAVVRKQSTISDIPEIVKKCFNQFCPLRMLQPTLNEDALDPEVNELQKQILSTIYKPVKLKNGQKFTFCETCFTMFNRNMKCDYCFQVYYDASDDAQMDGKVWIECDGCQKWNHTDCEISLGTDKNLKSVAMDLNAALAHPEEEDHSSKEEKPYWCQKCRRVKAAEQTKKERAEQPKVKPKAAPVQERVSTRQLAKAVKQKESEEMELDSLEESKENPEVDDHDSKKRETRTRRKQVSKPENSESSQKTKLVPEQEGSKPSSEKSTGKRKHGVKCESKKSTIAQQSNQSTKQSQDAHADAVDSVHA